MARFRVIEVLVELWEELPELAGERWGDIRPRLEELLRRFADAEDDEERAEANIRARRLLEDEASDILKRIYD